MIRLILAALLLFPVSAFALCADVATCKQEILDSDQALIAELEAVGVFSHGLLRTSDHLDTQTLAELQATRQAQVDFAE